MSKHTASLFCLLFLCVCQVLVPQVSGNTTQGGNNIRSPQDNEENRPKHQTEAELNQAIEIAEREKYSVRRVEFLGNYTTRDRILRRELTFDEGYEFTRKKLEISLARLNRLKRFHPIKLRDVWVELDSKYKEIDVTIKVVEKK
ncbi:MAG TPA: POTRA domain-containing protein [Acidobacteriota bacterium]|nr:POTRA domain-containing protein [Acidobacteriota bacterium]